MENMEHEGIDYMMDQEDVSRILKVSTKTLEYWRCRGGGPDFIKIGKLVRYRMPDLKEFIQRSVDMQKCKLIA